MGIRWQPLTPLAAVAGGVLAGVVGTVCLDAVQYARYRRNGGTKAPLEWEFAAVDTWADAPDPGQVGKRVIEGFTQRELPDRWAWLISTVMHWGYGSTWGAAYGVLAGSLRRPIRGTACRSAPWSSPATTSSCPRAGCTSRSGSTTPRPWVMT